MAGLDTPASFVHFLGWPLAKQEDLLRWASFALILLALAAYGLQWTGAVRHPLLYAATFCLAFFGCVINHNHQHHPTFVSAGLNFDPPKKSWARPEHW